MSRRSSLLLLALATMLLAAFGGGAVAAAATRHRATCPTGTGRLIVADRFAEVYEGSYRHSRKFSAVWGCTFASGRPHELGAPHRTAVGYRGLPTEARISVEHVTLTGTDVAYEESRGGLANSASFKVFVVELKSGSVLHDAPTGSWYPPVEYSPPESFEHLEGVGPVMSIVLAADGSAAWIAEAAARLGTYQVHVVGAHAYEGEADESREIARGSDIDPDSLALAGGTLYWTQGGQAHSTTLEQPDRPR